MKKINKAFYEIFASENGEIALKYLEELGKLNDDTFCRDSERLNCYLQGRRSIVIEIKKLIERGKNELFNQQ